MQHTQFVLCMRFGRRVVMQLNVNSYLRRALLQKRLVGDYHQRLFMIEPIADRGRGHSAGSPAVMASGRCIISCRYGIR